MKLEELITVATFNEWDKADALRLRLDEAGVPAQLFDEGFTQRLWWFVPEPKAQMRVRVEKERSEEALALIARWDEEEGILSDAVRCPECGSSRIEYPQFSRRTAMTVFFGILALFHLLPRQFYCRNCHFTWRAEPPKPEPERSVLNWTIRKPAVEVHRRREHHH
ncbi:MAG TPA: hypothetical protein VNQ90_07185 [Chthoniobacteraceae bacterium]|nr:hypothetical protein [Chthoniobacteraceae bacterium]